jgi:pathogenesis-related protein 1
MMRVGQRHAARGALPRFRRFAAAIGGQRCAGRDKPKERRMRTSRALGLIIALLLAVAAAHGQSPPTFSAHELLDAHNSARAWVGSPPLVWSRPLAGDARRWADQLLATHAFAQQPNDPHGENLFMVAGGSVTPTAVVQTWIAERGDYKPDTNTCAGVCIHYTQVVWRTTHEVGCGMAFDGYRQVWVCEYEPRGNVAGSRPY